MLSSFAKSARPTSRLLRPHARGLCSPPLVEEVRGTIAMIKSAASASPGGYTADTFKADLEAGKVDASMLAEAMSFSDEAKKLALKMNQEINMDRMKGAKDVSIDWAAWEGKVASPGLVTMIKEAYDAEIKSMTAAAGLDKLAAESQADLKKIFHGPGGLVRILPDAAGPTCMLQRGAGVLGRRGGFGTAMHSAHRIGVRLAHRRWKSHPKVRKRRTLCCCKTSQTWRLLRSRLMV